MRIAAIYQSPFFFLFSLSLSPSSSSCGMAKDDEQTTKVLFLQGKHQFLYNVFYVLIGDMFFFALDNKNTPFLTV